MYKPMEYPRLCSEGRLQKTHVAQQDSSCCLTHKTTHPDTPRRSGSASPRKRSPVRIVPNVPSSLSQLIGTLDYEDSSVLDSIPEREWRLLAALARKREEDDEREKLADQFRRMWQKEKEERDLVEAETNNQYKSYIDAKRYRERCWHQHQRLQRTEEQLEREGRLVESIRYKERRSRAMLARRDDRKTLQSIDKAIEEEARAALAADRRHRQLSAERLRRRAELYHAQSKAMDAGNRRNARLRDAAQRLAITNALNTWETTLLRQEITAMEAARRASHAAHAALTSERSEEIARERETRLKRARKLAAITAQMREDLKAGRSQ